MLQFKLMMAGVWAAIAPTLMLCLSTMFREALRIGLSLGMQAMTDPSLRTGSQRGDFIKAGIKAEIPNVSMRVLNLVGEVVANKFDPKI